MSGDDADQYNNGHCGCDEGAGGTGGCKCGSLYPNVMTLALQAAKTKATYMPNVSLSHN